MKEKRYVTLSDYERRVIVLSLNRLRNRVIADGIDPIDVDIIERNEQPISMAKILGFQNGEIAALYILPTAIVVTVFALISFVMGYFLMIWIFKVFMMQMDGYFAFYMTPASMVLSVVYLLVGYAFVSVIDFVRIKRIPMDEALKNIDV